MSNVSVSDHFVISAVRYALGRSTYIVGVTVDEVIRVWDELSPNTQAVIRRDVQSADSFGMECDADDWARLLNRIGRP